MLPVWWSKSRQSKQTAPKSNPRKVHQDPKVSQEVSLRVPGSSKWMPRAPKRSLNMIIFGLEDDPLQKAASQQSHILRVCGWTGACGLVFPAAGAMPSCIYIYIYIYIYVYTYISGVGGVRVQAHPNQEIVFVFARACTPACGCQIIEFPFSLKLDGRPGEPKSDHHSGK